MTDSIYVASNVLKHRASPLNLSAYERVCRYLSAELLRLQIQLTTNGRRKYIS